MRAARKPDLQKYFNRAWGLKMTQIELVELARAYVAFSNAHKLELILGSLKVDAS